MIYELKHLKEKTKILETLISIKVKEVDLPIANPIFKLIPGDIEPWEKLKEE